MSAYGTRLYRMLTDAEDSSKDAAAGSWGHAAGSGKEESSIASTDAGGRSDVGSQQPLLSWKEVSLWMWPLFTQRWERFRTETLALAPCPLHDRLTHEPVAKLPSPVPLVYGEQHVSPLVPLLCGKRNFPGGSDTR